MSGGNLENEGVIFFFRSFCDVVVNGYVVEQEGTGRQYIRLVISAVVVFVVVFVANTDHRLRVGGRRIIHCCHIVYRYFMINRVGGFKCEQRSAVAGKIQIIIHMFAAGGNFDRTRMVVNK